MWCNKNIHLRRILTSNKKSNNLASNLEWVTKSYNVKDAYKRNGSRHGENGSNSKLKNEFIPLIFRLYNFGVSQEIISRTFNVSQATISNVIGNKTFKNIIEKGEAIDINTIDGFNY